MSESDNLKPRESDKIEAAVSVGEQIETPVSVGEQIETPVSVGEQIETAVTRAEQNARAEAPDPQNPRALRNALGRFATGVTVVTTREAAAPHAPVGITVNSFASVSLDPALVLWSAARSSQRHPHFVQAQAFAIHVLAEDQREMAERFTRNGLGFEGLDLSYNAHDVPLLNGTLARFECVTEATHEGGDHTIIIGRITAFCSRDAAPLLFAAGQFGRLA